MRNPPSRCSSPEAVGQKGLGTDEGLERKNLCITGSVNKCEDVVQDEIIVLTYCHCNVRKEAISTGSYEHLA